MFPYGYIAIIYFPLIYGKKPSDSEAAITWFLGNYKAIGI